jgi:thymidylate kinase
MVLAHPALRGGILRYAKDDEIPVLVANILRTELRAFGKPRSRIIAVEGPDFVGKSSLVGALKSILATMTGRELAITTDPPWEVPPWKDLRGVFRYDERLSKKAEALLYLTARVDNYRRNVKPILENGGIVLADRWIDSWLAYQSVRLAQDAGDARRALEFLLAQEMLLESFGDIELPGLSILLMAQIDELFRRASSRDEVFAKYELRSNIEAVMGVYDHLYTRFPHRIVRIETTGRSEEDVLKMATDVVADYLRFHGLFMNESEHSTQAQSNQPRQPTGLAGG